MESKKLFLIPEEGMAGFVYVAVDSRLIENRTKILDSQYFFQLHSTLRVMGLFLAHQSDDSIDKSDKKLFEDLMNMIDAITDKLDESVGDTYELLHNMECAKEQYRLETSKFDNHG
jgi:hypothetical protein